MDSSAWQSGAVDETGNIMTYEVDGKLTPITDIPWVKNAPDLKTFVKTALDANRELGRRLPLPGKDAKPEERQAFLGKLYEQGFLEAPPKDSSGYGLTKPDVLPDGIGWNDEMAKAAGDVFLKHGISAAAAKDLLDLYGKALVGTQDGLKTTYEEGMASLEREFGKDKLPALMEDAKRLTNAMFKDHPGDLEILNASGLGDHPAILRTILKLAPLAQQDSSFVKDISRPTDESSVARTREGIQGELRDIMANPNNPKHAGWLKQDKSVMEYVDGLYTKAFPDAGKVTIT